MTDSLRSLEIVRRVLDPTPLTDDEIELHTQWAQAGPPLSFINFHHPLYIGLHHEWNDDENDPEDVKKLKEMSNARLRLTKKHARMHRVSHDETQRFWFIERPYRPTALLEMLAKGLFEDDDDARAKFIMNVWTDTESAYSVTWHGIMAFLWPRGWRQPDLDKHLDPSGTTTVYRGIHVDKGTNVSRPLGSSWTLDREQAEWFSTRLMMPEDEDAFVLTGEVDNKDVLFYINDRGEQEVVSPHVTLTSKQKVT